MSLSSILLGTFQASAHLNLLCFNYCFSGKGGGAWRGEVRASKPQCHEAAEPGLKSKETGVGTMSLYYELAIFFLVRRF